MANYCWNAHKIVIYHFWFFSVQLWRIASIWKCWTMMDGVTWRRRKSVPGREGVILRSGMKMVIPVGSSWSPWRMILRLWHHRAHLPQCWHQNAHLNLLPWRGYLPRWCRLLEAQLHQPWRHLSGLSCWRHRPPLSSPHRHLPAPWSQHHPLR